MRLFNEGFYLHSRVTVKIFNSDAPVRLFNFIGWGEFLLGSVQVLRHRVRGEWGVQLQLLTLMMLLGGAGGPEPKL